MNLVSNSSFCLDLELEFELVLTKIPSRDILVINNESFIYYKLFHLTTVVAESSGNKQLTKQLQEVVDLDLRN